MSSEVLGRKWRPKVSTRIRVANAIHNAALSTTNYPEEDLRYLRHCMWIDNQAKVSLSEERNGKYPDASLVLDPLVRQTWELDASKPELSVSPLQVIAVVGVKSFKARDGTAPTKQVIGFLLRSLSEQLDRRFILGFIVQQSHIVVLIHDRSGVLVTERSLGIYEDPDFFIRLISAFAVLTADKLGFNPTMKP
ncbi:hypothetical protein BDN70DRAFT_695097 [Pholiota conissans]|uniref:Fungal-type protein kinase domain-containing protein n=1 Tax=Pholiota conissans TaxID=109636 RepID=A0A9P6CUA4_9AGAR|nr:hypothetical protein BDN70DRAFT_695097 [Pholiota conissans]